MQRQQIESFDALYRPQNCSFAEAEELIPYVNQLLAGGGLYLPEVREAGSYVDRKQPDQRNRDNPHGYDLIGSRASEALGGAKGLDTLLQHLTAMGMGRCLDAVLHHTSDAHPDYQSGSDDYDHVTLADGTKFDGTFFGYAWLPRWRQTPEVFHRRHGWLLDLAAEHGCFIRVDHPGGLDDPIWMQEQLAERGLSSWWEHILTHDRETLPRAPNLLGDVGYRGLNLVNRLFHSGNGVEMITQRWREACGVKASFEETDRQCRYEAALASGLELRRAIESLNGHSHELTVKQLARAASTSPVYRTYKRERQPLSAQDGWVLDVMEMPDWLREGIKQGRFADFTRHFQATGPRICAKGREDHAFYQYTPVMGLNEVGSPRNTLPRSEFCQLADNWIKQCPNTLWDTATHDTKRCLRLRAASAYNTRRPEAYLDVMDRLLGLCQKHNPNNTLSTQAVWLILDEAMGVWPLDVNLGVQSRFLRAMRDSFRHGRLYTGWSQETCNLAWELAMAQFVGDICNDAEIRTALESYSAHLQYWADELALSQQLLALFCSNKAVIYHGSEGPGVGSEGPGVGSGRPGVRRLMDPWNREAVNYRQLHELLRGLVDGGPVTPANRMINLIWVAQHAKKEHGARNTPVEFLDNAPERTVAVRRGDLIAVASYDTSVRAVLPGLKPENDLLGGNYRQQAIYLAK